MSPFDLPLATVADLHEELAEVRAQMSRMGYSAVIDPTRYRDRLLELKAWETRLVRQITEREAAL